MTISYFVLANAIVYMDEDDSMLKAVEFFKKAATIFENIIVDLYEKAGVETVLDPQQQFKRGLLKERAADDETLKEAKSLLKDLYQKIEETLTEEEAKKQYKELKKKEEEENKQALDAFGKPIEDEKKVNKLGFFGRKAAAVKEAEASKTAGQETQETPDQKPDIVKTKPN